MNEEKILDYLVEIKSKLAETNANLTNIQTIIQNHENRIIRIETDKTNTTSISFKDEIIQYLIKGLVASISIIGTIAGTGSIIAKIFGS